MKKFITLLMLIFIYGIANAQTTDNNKIGQSFVTKVSIVVRPYDDKTKKIINYIHYLLNDDTKFFVYDVCDSGYLISVWDFPSKYTQSKHLVAPGASRDTATKRIYYNRMFNQNPSVAKSEKSVIVANDAYYRMTKSQVGMAEDTIPAISAKLNIDINLDYVKFRDLAYIDEWGNNMKFFIPLKEFNDKCQTVYPKSTSFTWGFLTLPIKARIFKGPFQFEEKVNFGVSFGCKWQMPSTTYSAHNMLFGVSISNVRVDSTNSTSAAKNMQSLTSTSAFSFSGGYMYQYDKFQIGAFIGMDYISNNKSIGWRYQGVPWLGVGLGLSLFSENKTSPQKDQTQTDHN